MMLTLHARAGQTAAEVVSDSLLIHQEQDSLRLMEELYGSGTRKLILHQANIAPEFFDLSTGLAGAVLQKFTTYQIQVAIVGDFSTVTSRSLSAFIYESNRGSQVFFVDSVDAALQKLLGEAS